jgi:hypothetical protein
MKNLLIFINPSKKFDKEGESLIKIQIDNSLELGWDIKDIIFVTNFDYEYNGVKALVIGDESYCGISTKTTTILKLFELGLIGNELYWCHDLDAFQLVEIPEVEIDLEGADIGLCNYGRMPKWAGGSIFFRHNAKKFFEEWNKGIKFYKNVDEVVLFKMTNDDESLRNKVKKMNISYNFLPFNLWSCYKMALKPLRVAHFHPSQGRKRMGIDNMLDFYKGKNKMGISLIPERLIKIFDKNL